MLSGATWCFDSIGLVHSVIGEERDVVYDNKWQHDQVPLTINKVCTEGRDALAMH